jgi:NAD(P)-dependent dehydrogenase (short-subunit alcohol dehydrogenase family)
MPENVFDLTGRVALITGGNGGIGLGMAMGLARAGADVVIWGRNAAKNEQAVDALSRFGTRVVAQIVDVTDEDASNGAFAEALEEMGRFDFVAANAGGGQNIPFDELSTEAWRQTMTVNLDSAFWIFREACRHMVQRTEDGDVGGSLLVTSSIAALNNPPRAQAYAAAKSAAIALVRSIAAEYGKYGIRANALLPGYIRSELSAHLQENERFNDVIIRQRVPMKRWGEPGDFAGLAVYLASDLSSFHTAQAFVIDGGYANS